MEKIITAYLVEQTIDYGAIEYCQTVTIRDGLLSDVLDTNADGFSGFCRALAVVLLVRCPKRYSFSWINSRTKNNFPGKEHDNNILNNYVDKYYDER